MAGNKHQKISSGAGNKIGFSSFSNKVQSDCIPTVIIKMKSSVVFQCFCFVFFVFYIHARSKDSFSEVPLELVIVPVIDTITGHCKNY